MVLLALPEHKVQRELLVFKEPLVLQVLQEQQELMGLQELLVLQVQLAQQVLMELQV